MTRVMRIVAIIIALGVIIFAGMQLGAYFYKGSEENAVNDELAEIANLAIGTKWEDPDIGNEANTYAKKLFGKAAPNNASHSGKQTPESLKEAEKRKINFSALKEKNKDIIAWISIPNTPIDYAVVKAKDNSYYLSRNAMRKSSTSGAIFLDSKGKSDFTSRDSILYGHRMKDRTMFGSLIWYRNKKYAEEHSYIFIYTPKATKKYRVEKCYKTIKENLVPDQSETETLTLVTCDDPTGKIHYIVRAQLVSSKDNLSVILNND
ncbi:MAG: class B sortase [Coriobacteriia bacterium]|nr:class B sortase [Coriobacteriia bacterium]